MNKFDVADQTLLDLAALADPEEGLRQGLEDIAKGRTRSAREVFAKLREDYGVRGYSARNVVADPTAYLRG